MSHPFKLIRTNGVMIPGGYQFHDAITGKTYLDKHTLFPSRVLEIIRDRRANHRLFTDEKFLDPTYVADELSIQSCQRLKNNGLLCSNGLPRVNGPVDAAPVMAVGRTCRFCGGTELTEIVCATCSGRRITGYKCVKCHKENPR